MKISRIPIGVVIKQIIDEKRLKGQEVADRLKVSRQTVYQSYSKVDMSEGEIVRWAKALGVTVDELLERREVQSVAAYGTISEHNSQKSTSEYLFEQLARLEEQFKGLYGQLEMKDRQIEKLLDILGKLDLGESLPCLVIGATDLRMSA